jgi:hypothetical protein
LDVGLHLYTQGYMISLFFFGAFCAIIGCLFAVGRLIPWPLALLIVLAGAGWTVLSAADIAVPALGASLTPTVLVVGAATEIALGLWLLIRGVNLKPR